jgi:predicted amino acid-binding ACT domain protein
VTGATVHVLSQYLWPDDAPTGIYAEQLADSLAATGVPVRLVGGQGSYRRGRLVAPRTSIVHLKHYLGRRYRLVSTAREYESVREAFASYIRSQVAEDDVVIITTVGAGMRGMPGVASRVCGALANQGINILVIAQGSSEYSISLVVAADDATKAVQALHELIG